MHIFLHFQINLNLKIIFLQTRGYLYLSWAEKFTIG